MNGGKRPLGYTIVEVMIVLAISGVMFVIAASFISGKQENAAFHEGVYEFASQLQLMISQVQDGQYSGISFGCQYNAGSNTIHIYPDAASSQGTNSQCDFLGKFAHFSENGDPSQYEIFSLAGGRQDPTDLGSVQPIDMNGVNLTDQDQIPQSLDITNVTVTDQQTGHTDSDTWGLGFAQSTEQCKNEICPTNSQTLEMVYTTALDGRSNLSESSAVTDISNSLAFASQAQICITDYDRYALVTLGAGNGASPFNVAVNVFTKPYSPNPPC